MCLSVYYCTREHQEKDWTLGHRTHCPTLKIQNENRMKNEIKNENKNESKNDVSKEDKKIVEEVVKKEKKVENENGIEEKKDENEEMEEVSSGVYDALIDQHPSSVGPDGCCPEDIWDARRGIAMVIVDLKEVGGGLVCVVCCEVW